MTIDSHRAIIDETTLLIAETGVRGATLRKVGARSGVTRARLASDYGDKDRLIAACFADVVDRDITRLQALADEQGIMAIGAEIVAPLLWTLCEEAAGRRRTDNLVLTELLLASGRPRLSGIFREWIQQRHGILWKMAVRAALDPLVFDILGLIILIENGYAVSNYDSVSYRLVAQTGFIEAFTKLTDTGNSAYGAGLNALVSRYYIKSADPAEMLAPDQAGGSVQGKDQIIAAAAAILEEQGLDQITNRAVAKRAGVSLALTTYHFRSINELILAGLRRTIENMTASLEPEATRREMRNTILATRRPLEIPESERRIHRGILRISLAAARSKSEAHLGHLIRRQLGMLAYATIDPDERGESVTRTCAASYALWAAAAYLVAPAFPETDRLFDFEAQSALVRQRLLGIS